MPRPLSRLWLLLWAGLLLSPVVVAGEAGPASGSPTVSGREGSALVARAPAIARPLFQDQSTGAAPLPSIAGAAPVALTGRQHTAVAQPFPAVAATVLASNYPTGPPTLS
jgi:hypothetical protein